MSSLPHNNADYLGFDIGTDAITLVARSQSGTETILAIPNLGKTLWHDGEAHDLNYIPLLMLNLVYRLQLAGWQVSPKTIICFAVRQHDLVVLGNEFEKPLIPALSWQCNEAKVEADWMNGMPKLVVDVGKVEKRFILPKVRWVFNNDPKIANQASSIMTTGDWISGMLTGNHFLSTSDGISNGLLKQRDKSLAVAVFNSVGLNPTLFSAPIQSGELVGEVLSGKTSADAWDMLRSELKGCRLVASLGDNHAGGVGAGLVGEDMIVISFGNSGTVIRCCPWNTMPAGNCSQFEYFNKRLLLSMLHRCAAFYNFFLKREYRGSDPTDHQAMDAAALQVTMMEMIKVDPELTSADHFPADWMEKHPAVQVASVQASIAAAMLKHTEKIRNETLSQVNSIKRCVLVGGLSRAPLIQQVMTVGLQDLIPGITVEVSNRTGALASQAAAYGAMMTAMRYDKKGDLASVIAQCCPTRQCQRSSDGRIGAIKDWLKQ